MIKVYSYKLFQSRQKNIIKTNVAFTNKLFWYTMKMEENSTLLNKPSFKYLNFLILK